MGKPTHGNRYATNNVVAVSSAGTGIAWSNGEFTGPEEALTRVKAAIAFKHVVNLFGLRIEAGSQTPLAALGAMASLWPGRTIITQAPNDVIDAIERYGYPHTFLPKEYR